MPILSLQLPFHGTERHNRVIRYRADIIEALAAHGIVPGPDTEPARVHDYLDELYRYELRALRGRLVRREFPKTEYAARVRALRRRYPLLSVPIERWTT